ncbi:MAG: hypothetical protein IPQ07_45085 [Myxococcales bacterium]|nr:hypothetical protein [Myxococcales bacterium]
MRRALVAIVVFAGCRDVPAAPDAFVREDAPDASTDKARNCATVFGSSLTNAFGRLDGTVLAVVPPGDRSCPMPNGTHLVLQVMMGGQAYRMVTNVLSDQGPPNVYTRTFDAPLAGSAWAEGWHPGTPLDYVATLAVHSDSFTAHTMAETVAFVTDAIELDTRISVFATSSGGANASGAHLVHRNAPNADGAIVIGPETASPHYLLFRFDEQAF